MARRSRVLHLTNSPPLVLAICYLAVVMAGAAALLLPWCNTGGLSISDAIFTATSAVTVTGLVVVDTGTAFTLAGQIVVALLIQFGGLGLMVFAVLILSAFGIPLGMPHKVMLRDDLNQATISNLGRLVRLIVAVAVICEAVGAALLMTVFVPEFGWAEGLWQAVFHAVSAFNNAGFALFPDSLSRWVADPVVNITITALFMLGGLGFIVVGDIRQAGNWRRLTLHSKLMLSGTLALVALGVLGFAALEWRNPETLAGLSTLRAKLWASWFQGVTPRTAGFNTIDTTQMGPTATLLTMLLMVVGGGSTSTAGGIKVTSMVVMVIATIAFFRKRQQLNIFGRALGSEEVLKVMALTTVSFAVMFVGLVLLTIGNQGDFLDLAFEIASAFGTVGLSHGATGTLQGLDRAVIIAIMFLGRVGPLTLGFFLATKGRPRVRYPRGHIYLG